MILTPAQVDRLLDILALVVAALVTLVQFVTHRRIKALEKRVHRNAVRLSSIIAPE